MRPSSDHRKKARIGSGGEQATLHKRRKACGSVALHATASSACQKVNVVDNAYRHRRPAEIITGAELERRFTGSGVMLCRSSAQAHCGGNATGCPTHGYSPLWARRITAGHLIESRQSSVAIFARLKHAQRARRSRHGGVGGQRQPHYATRIPVHAMFAMTADRPHPEPISLGYDVRATTTMRRSCALSADVPGSRGGGYKRSPRNPGMHARSCVRASFAMRGSHDERSSSSLILDQPVRLRRVLGTDVRADRRPLPVGGARCDDGGRAWRSRRLSGICLTEPTNTPSPPNSISKGLAFRPGVAPHTADL